MSGKRQKIPYSLALEPQGRSETPVSGRQRPSEGRTICGEASTRKPGGDGTTNGGGVRRRESSKCVETRSKEPGQSWRGWDDHRRRQGLPARTLAKHTVSIA